MKRMVAFLSVICIVFMISTLVSAQTQMSASSSQVTLSAKSSSDNPGWLTVNPAISVGYLWHSGTSEYTLSTYGPGLGGVRERLYEFETSSAVYLAGRIPFTFGKRLEATLSGSWAIPVGSSDVNDAEFAMPDEQFYFGGRSWKSKTDWVNGDFQVSYAILKDLDILKALSPVVGLRYDYWRTKYYDPHNVTPGFAVASPADTGKFQTSSLLPYIGLTFTIGGLQFGTFGGDLKLGAMGGWIAWGKVKHYETRDMGGIRHDTFKGKLHGDGYLFDFAEFFIDYTVFSLPLSQRIQGSLSLFAKYNLFYGGGELEGTRMPAGTFDTFDFKMNRSSAVAGISAALKF